MFFIADIFDKIQKWWFFSEIFAIIHFLKMAAAKRILDLDDVDTPKNSASRLSDLEFGSFIYFYPLQCTDTTLHMIAR